MTWHFRHRQSGFTYACEGLHLYWEVQGDGQVAGDPVRDSAGELWAVWRGIANYPTVRIFWSVQDSAKGVAERAPSLGEDEAPHFLTHFTWPEDENGVRLRWAELPVADKQWSVDQADPGGFIQAHTGWKPSALQQTFDVGLIERLT